MVELPGYTSVEKLAIAKNHLVPKQMAEHGIETAEGVRELDINPPPPPPPA